MRVDKSGDCWLWTGVINLKRGGYGYFYDDDTRLRRAHRVAWEMTHGRIGEEQYLLHSCDTPHCVRPEHLRVGSQKENLDEMRAKGRRTGSRLTPEKVRWLRVERANGRSNRDTAAELGVCESTVDKADRRVNWAEVD